jgi:hypothetical protein
MIGLPEVSLLPSQLLPKHVRIDDLLHLLLRFLLLLSHLLLYVVVKTIGVDAVGGVFGGKKFTTDARLFLHLNL